MRKKFGGMGFHHLYSFNFTMLGKQGWKFQTNHESIVTQFFKAKYFPNGDFLGARLGHNPIYVWRSIHASQVIIKEGIRWNLGDGNSMCLERPMVVR